MDISSVRGALARAPRVREPNSGKDDAVSAVRRDQTMAAVFAKTSGANLSEGIASHLRMLPRRSRSNDDAAGMGPVRPGGGQHDGTRECAKRERVGHS